VNAYAPYPKDVARLLEVVSAQEVLTEYKLALLRKKEAILRDAGYTKVQNMAPLYTRRGANSTFIFVPPGCRLLPIGEKNPYGACLADGKGQAHKLVTTWSKYLSAIIRIQRAKLLTCAGCAGVVLPLAQAPHRKGCPNA
jgi:hypothetical protein